MTKTENPADRPPGINLTTLERMLSVGGAAMRPALIAQILADLARLRAGLATDRPATIRNAAHELKGIAATLGAESLAQLAECLDQGLENAVPGDRDARLVELGTRIDDLVALLQAETRRVPAA